MRDLKGVLHLCALCWKWKLDFRHFHSRTVKFPSKMKKQLWCIFFFNQKKKESTTHRVSFHQSLSSLKFFTYWENRLSPISRLTRNMRWQQGLPVSDTGFLRANMFFPAGKIKIFIVSEVQHVLGGNKHWWSMSIRLLPTSASTLGTLLYSSEYWADWDAGEIS